ncbi:hypothetical protein FGG08_000631 [Glutinoglossum americanum]|uniref:Uncharacterized protein n=1 Tax=Glutinoglossum americanum TaxID=1670608 RepID=A0A9P8IG83_9PEZI|nr:hypothetical protein FGG08_000631 [Glutinoglossum americanum]
MFEISEVFDQIKKMYLGQKVLFGITIVEPPPPPQTTNIFMFEVELLVIATRKYYSDVHRDVIAYLRKEGKSPEQSQNILWTDFNVWVSVGEIGRVLEQQWRR